MRMIPKKSKINTTIWKGFTFFDLIFLFVLFVLAVLILMSNTTVRWYILMVYIPVSCALMFEVDDTRFYRDIVFIAKYLVAPKAYGDAAKKEKARQAIDYLIPQSGIDDDGTILYGDYYSAVIEVGAIEFRLLNEFTQNYKISLLTRVVNCLTTEQSLQLVKIDRPINFDEISARIFDKLKAAKKEQPINYGKIAILKSRLAQMDALNNIEKQFRPYYYFVLYDSDRESLKGTLNYILNVLDGMELAANVLGQKDAAVFLKYCYTRNFDERDIDNYTPDKYLDFVKPKSVKFYTQSCEIDGTWSFTSAISDYPLTVGNAWGADIFNIDNTKVVLNIKPVDKEKAIKQIDRTVIEVSSRDNVNKASEMLAQDTHLETMAGLLGSLQNENEGLFDCTLTITSFNNEADTQNSAFKKKMRRAIMTSGFKVNPLRCRQFDGFISSSITRRNRLSNLARSINSESLAAIFPFVFTSVIDTDGLALGFNQYPVILDIWKWKYRGGNYTNANMFVVGKSGAGKSYFAGLENSLLYSDDCKIFILDPENEYSYLVKNLGGTIIDVGSAKTGKLNPFHIYQVLTDDGKKAPPDVVFQAHLQMLENFFKSTLDGITSDSLEELNNLVVACYEKRGITQNTDCDKLKATAFPTFDDLLAEIKTQIKNTSSPIKRANLERVETYITKFAAGGRYSNLWNGAATLETSSQLVVFNFQSLFESKNNIVVNGQMLLVMRYLDQQIYNVREENRVSNKTKHIFIAVDEGYNFIDAKYPIALDFIFLKYKRIRKYDGSICFLTQNLNDIVGNKEIIAKTSAIINNSQYSFIFGLAAADVAILTEIYENAGGINEAEQNEIANATRGQCFLVSAQRERTSFEVVASDVVEGIFKTELGADAIRELAGIENDGAA